MGKRSKKVKSFDKRFSFTEPQSKVLNKVNSTCNIKGLQNLGNTCYFNAAVQCLSRSPSLLHYLSAPKQAEVILTRPEEDLVCTMKFDLIPHPCPTTQSFIELITALNQTSTGLSTINPKDLRDTVIGLCPRFDSFGQQDSHEFLRALLDCMKQEELTRWKKGILKKLDVNSKNLDENLKASVRNWGKAASMATTIDHLFGGIIVNTLECCYCGTIRSNFEPFLDISLPISAPTDISVAPRKEREQLLESVGKSKQDIKRERKRKNIKQRKQRQQREQSRRNYMDDLDSAASDSDSVDEITAIPDNSHENESVVHDISSLNEPSPIPTNDQSVAEDVLSVSDMISCPVIQDQQSGIEEDESEIDSSSGNCADTENSENRHPTHPNLDVQDSIDSEPILLTTLNDPETNENQTQITPELVNKLATDLSHFDINSQDSPLSGSQELEEALRFARIPIHTQNSVSYKDDSLYFYLQKYTSPEFLTGSNRLACDFCTKRQNGSENASGSIDQVIDEMNDLELNSEQAKPAKSVCQDTIKRDLILHPPPLLTIHLKRFQRVGRRLQKCQKRIEFPVELDLRPFCSVLGTATHIRYRLYAVIEHIGRLAAGHYVAYVALVNTMKNPTQPSMDTTTGINKFVKSLNKAPKWPMSSYDLVQRLRRCERSQLLKAASSLNGSNSCQSWDAPVQSDLWDDSTRLPDTRQWFHVSDSRVNHVSLEDVLKCQPYVLFYERVD